MTQDTGTRLLRYLDYQQPGYILDPNADNPSKYTLRWYQSDNYVEPFWTTITPMKQSLLSHIATNFISEYENVANSSIAYLLNQYDIARVALKNILVVESVPTYYITELSTDGNGRPDVTGLNSDGTK